MSEIGALWRASKILDHKVNLFYRQSMGHLIRYDCKLAIAAGTLDPVRAVNQQLRWLLISDKTGV